MAKNTDEVKTEGQNALAEINQFLESAESAAAQVVGAANEAKAKLEEITNSLAEKSATIESRVADYEKLNWGFTMVPTRTLLFPLWRVGGAESFRWDLATVDATSSFTLRDLRGLLS